MADSPDSDTVAIDSWQAAREEHGVVVVFCLLHWVCGVLRKATAGAPTAMVVDEDCETGGLEAFREVGNVVFFEES